MRNFGIKTKIVALTTVTSVVALIVTSLIALTVDQKRYDKEISEDMRAHARVAAANSAAAVAFQQPDEAEEILKSLHAKEEIVAAILFDKNGKEFATYLHADHAQSVKGGTNRKIIEPVCTRAISLAKWPSGIALMAKQNT